MRSIAYIITNENTKHILDFNIQNYNIILIYIIDLKPLLINNSIFLPSLYEYLFKTEQKKANRILKKLRIFNNKITNIICTYDEIKHVLTSYQPLIVVVNSSSSFYIQNIIKKLEFPILKIPKDYKIKS